MFCGNGEKPDAQHLAAELSGRFYFDRSPLMLKHYMLILLILLRLQMTCYKDTYSRMIESAGRKGDVLFALSTSGNSNNVIKAIEKAKDIGMITIGLTGLDGGKVQVKILFYLYLRIYSRVKEGRY